MSADRLEISACRLARALTLVMLGFTLVVSVSWSHVKLLSQDEMYEFQTDSVGSLRQLAHVQRTSPISLDPLLYHSLSHMAMRIFGAGAFSQRLPALLGFLLMQVCLFFLVRRIAGERAGAVAAAFPALTASLYYSAEGRPYGLLLGLYALALLCWVVATQEAAAPRWRALAGLTLAIAATLNTHYFGVLLLLPLAAAELWRTIKHRRLGGPMMAAIVLGASSVAFTQPYMKATAVFRTHYYNQGSVGLHDITRAYRSMLVDYTRLPMNAQRVWVVVLVASATALVFGCLRMSRSSRIDSSVWVLLTTLAALPFAGYLLARFVTHSIEVRYVLGALVAISALLAIAVARWLASDRVFSITMAGICLAVLIGGAVRIHAEQGRSAERLSTLALPDEASRFLRLHPDRRLYMQDMGAFEEDRFYIADADLKSRTTLIYSAAEELRWNHHDTMALTAEHLQHFTLLPIVPYEQVRTLPGQQLFLLRHSGWDWTDQALTTDGAQVQVIGHAFGGDVALVRFHEPQ